MPVYEIDLPDPGEGFEVMSKPTKEALEGDMKFCFIYGKWVEVGMNLTYDNPQIIARRKELTGLEFIRELETGSFIDYKGNRYLAMDSCFYLIDKGNFVLIAEIYNYAWVWHMPNEECHCQSISASTCTVYPPESEADNEVH